MDETINFSFIMPAYKAKFLYQVIESILNQSYRHLELIVVNDASPEKLKEIVDQFSDNRIKYIENEKNIGGIDLVANWNHCINYANNDYIILATDDDSFEPDFLYEAVKLIKKYPNINLIRSGVKKFSNNNKIVDIEFPLKEFMTSREFTLCWAKDHMISCVSNYIFKRKKIIEIGGFISFPLAHFSDDATALAIAENGVANIPKNCMNFRVSEINLSNNEDYRIAIKQIKATDEFMSWFFAHVKLLDVNKGDFFERACYGGCKNKCMTIIEKLVVKIPFSKFHILLKTILSIKNSFKNEKAMLLLYYLINKK